MVKLGTAELGNDHFAERLGVDPSKPFVEQILTCAYQPTENSGDVTRHAAATVAEDLGARYSVIDVRPMLAAYRVAIEKSLGRELTWERDDITLQNLQARVRSPSIWALANERNAILIAMSNCSQAAVGYMTMDGDSSGGLAPISGVDKSFVLAWLRWLERKAPTPSAPSSPCPSSRPSSPQRSSARRKRSSATKTT